MIKRGYWIRRIHDGWKKRSIVWLAGVRRVGKTTLAKMIPDTIYLNCDLPSAIQRLDDPELFFKSLPAASIIVFDEIHRLSDPSRVLKIAADEFPGLRILATGSSTLGATRKFRDSLAGRKLMIRLPPVLWPETQHEFGLADIDHRLLHGGLPEYLLSPEKDDSLMAEWMDSFYARDIQELFAVRERTGFLNLLKLMLRQSGGLADYSALSRECDLSRLTVKAYLEAMSTACAVIPVPPFHGGGRREIIRRPKIYGFDTGFVAFVRGWRDIREEDRGILWEHLVLEHLQAHFPDVPPRYWRDKGGREIDFVLAGRRDEVHAVECKWDPASFDETALERFRSFYPDGRNYLVTPSGDPPYDARRGELVVRVCTPTDLHP